MQDYKDFITKTLNEVADIARHSFGKVSGTTKPEDNNQVLTETDIQIGNVIVEAIKASYPEHNIIDEEAGVIDNGSRYTWVVDPIDGTSNFANGVPTYGIMVGLLEEGTPIAGGVALPSFSQLYVAVKGEGAVCNGNSIHVTAEQDLLKTLVAYGIDGHQENPQITSDETAMLSQIILGIRNLRSSNSAFDFMLVADGRYGGYLNRTSKIWDNVAPQIIVEEAGGVFTDFFGKTIEYENPLSKVDENFTMCAAPPALHERLQQIISQEHLR
jgi:myo-inositol-1(or 4)-monophosphatase